MDALKAREQDGLKEEKKVSLKKIASVSAFNRCRKTSPDRGFMVVTIAGHEHKNPNVHIWFHTVVSDASPDS